MNDAREWLAADGLGGYAMGRADGIRSRRYHALLLVASPHDERRFALVNGADAWLDVDGGSVALSSQRYLPDVISPDGAGRLTSFTAEPWPAWTYRLGPDLSIVQELFATRGRAATVVRWRPLTTRPLRARLHVRPFFSGRDWHALHHENPEFRFEPQRIGDQIWRWTPYDGVPPIVVHANAEYRHEPRWYRRFLYAEDRDRGLDHVEDLASPGVFSWVIGEGKEAELLLSTSEDWLGYYAPGDLVATCRALRAGEQARVAAYKKRLHHSADEYVVQRGARHTIVAGYPWFTDWGRDTFIAVRGLCLATGRLDQAERILLSWCGALSEGMMPNLFPCGDGTPEYNSADAALWFVVVAREFLSEAARRGYFMEAETPKRLTDVCEEILQAYARGTRYGIGMDDDGLLRAGVVPDSRGDARDAGRSPAVALTWMDAIVDGHAVTPRVGKPVELQALWVNSLAVGARWSERWGDVADRARAAFAERFWNADRQCLFDVVDVDHRAGAVDARVRANQILACGGLPVALLDGERLRSVVDVVERKLWTPMGLRTLAPDEPGYVGRFEGTADERDRAYHQGTAWPWLVQAFVESWARAHGDDRPARGEARRRFLPALARHLDEAGIGHVSEIADGDAPHTPHGCPFQAWSVGEAIRAFGLGT